jgi:two-component system OmpR family response regulator/two-component system response regulator QseB
MRLLLVEDDPMLGRGMKRALEKAGYTVDWAITGLEALSATSAQRYAVIVLDLSLPEMDGVSVLRELRSGRDLTPVIVTTASGRADQKVSGLDAGADDYLVKPFDLDELLARIRAQIRRSENRTSDVIEAQGVSIDLQARVAMKAGVPVPLTAKELKILTLLMRRAGGFVSKDDLEHAIYDDKDGVESNTIEVAIYSLRKKFGPRFVITARGLGYMTPK